MANVQRKRIPAKLFKTVVGGNNPSLERALEPGKGKGYPYSMLGSRTKVPHEYYENYRLIEAVKKNVKGKFTSAQIKNALLKRSQKEYNAEWATAAKKSAEAKKATASQVAKQTTGAKMAQWATDITSNISRANNVNARLISPDLKRRIFSKGSASIMDLGSGKGLTIMPVIQRLSSFERARTNVYLVDVSGADLAQAKRSLVSMGVDPKRVQTLRVNFAGFGSNLGIMKLKGKVDIVTSGAALHHISKSEILFREVNKLLAKDGRFTFWDWGHPAWRAPSLMVAPEGAKVSSTGSTYTLGGKSFKAQAGSAFISREIYSSTRPTHKKPQELAATKEMLSTWISLLNFPQEERTRFEQYFDKRVSQGKPIKFDAYLRSLKNTHPSASAQIMVLEGHKPADLYIDAIKRSGMSATRDPHYITKSTLLYSVTARKK